MKYSKDRFGRTREIMDLYFGASNDITDAWFRAVEWYENRPSSGASPGERLRWCLTRNRALSADPDWPLLSEEQQALFERMALCLQPHRCS
jgi:hypothetical protein